MAMEMEMKCNHEEDGWGAILSSEEEKERERRKERWDRWMDGSVGKS